MRDALPSQEEVITLLKDNKIGKKKTYKQETIVLKTFSNYGIEMVVGVANSNLKNMSSYKNATME